MIERPADRLLRICAAEYRYYDGLPMGDPNRVEPIDILAALMMNAFFRSVNSGFIRGLHQNLAQACDSLLAGLPSSADLLAPSPPYRALQELLHAAVQLDGVLVPVAAKVFHRKRPRFIAMLDNVLLTYYLGGTPANPPSRTQDRRTAADAAIEALKLFRRDLEAVEAPIERLREYLEGRGFQLTPIRILDLLVWSEKETSGRYRA